MAVGLLGSDVFDLRAAAVTHLRLATAAPNGVYHAIGVGMAHVIEKRLPNIQVQVVESEGGFQNMRMLDDSIVDLALTQNDIAFNAVKTDRVLGHVNRRIFGLAVLYKELAQIVVAKRAGIHRLADLKGHTVVLGLPQSGSRFSSENVLPFLGLRPGTIRVRYIDYPEAARGIVDGTVDALIVWRAIPAPVLEELLQADVAELLPIDPEVVRGLRMNQPFLSAEVIPPGTYENQPNPVPSIAVKALLVGSASLRPALARSILDALFTNVPDLIAHHPRAADISLRSAFRLEDGMAIDLHPGARQFFEGSETR